MKEGQRIAYYRHRAGPTQELDPDPGNYYVSAIDCGRYALILGPFPTHQEALDNVDRAWAKAEELDPRAFWWSFGTLRINDSSTKPGVLNKFFPELFEKVVN